MWKASDLNRDHSARHSKAVTRTVRVAKARGIHARPAALFVKTASQFPNCRITVSNGVETVNGRSIMGVMTLGAAYGRALTIEAVGDQADEAVEALAQVIESKYDEE